jgi:hypothetical protein
MNEIEYVFNSDILEKKRTARGSRNKKCGAKSQKCTLPFESMKRKEREKMNGDIMNYKMSEFYTWEQFLAMPSDIQVEYVNRMSGYYNVGLSTLSMTLFGRKDDQTLRKHFTKAGLMDKLKVEMHRGGHAGRVRLVDDLRKAEQNRIEIPSTKELAADAKKSVVTVGSNRVSPADAKQEIIEKANATLPQTTGFAQIPQPSYLRDMMLEMDGFDLDTLQFLSNKYANKKIKLTVSVTVVE